MQGQGANAGGGRATNRMFLSGTASLVLGVTLAACGTPPGTHTRTVSFDSGDIRLAGALVTPAEGKAQAAIVYVDGSGATRRNLGIARRLAENGIAVLTYDKRGVGKSGGTYEGDRNVSEQNLLLLADDASAALDLLRGQPALKGLPVGFTGISQAGWIAPLAAQRNGKSDFLVLWSGPVCKVSEEDIFSKFTTDADAKSVPTWQQALAARTTPYVWPEFMGADTDPATSLRGLSIPGLWIVSVNDGSIPVDLSLAGLCSLRADGHRYDYALFSGLGHNNMDGTFATAVDWIRRLPK